MSERDFYKAVARHHVASTYMLGVAAVVMMENMNDEWFWEQTLEHFHPAKYKFVAGVQKETSIAVTTGCEQCMKFQGFLSSRFFVCMDSDLRYLLGNSVKASEGFMQTYTYSWENHCAYADRLHIEGIDFDFSAFLKKYSHIVYKGLLFLLDQIKNGKQSFTQRLFNSCLSLQYRKGDELDNGEAILSRLNERLEQLLNTSSEYVSFDYETISAEYALKGVTRDNAYLYVRGHNVYDMLNSLGKKICENNQIDFETSTLLTPINRYDYMEMSKIGDDIEVAIKLP